MASIPQKTAWDRRLVTTMALATGVVIANLYYAQPLADTLAREFDASTSAVGLVLTLISAGYAVGLATLVPLGDLLERRRLLAAMLGCTVIGLGVMALAPSLAVFGSAAVVVGLTSVATHVIVPLAAAIAPAGQQGRVVGTVMSGLLLGILLSRTVSGLVASVAGWRAVFAIAALANAGVTVLLWRELPKLAPAAKMRYPALLGSVVRLVREEPVLRRRILYGALAFASFNAFWTSYGFLVARPPYGWNEAQIGAFALLGAVGALAVKFTGRLADRGLAHVMTGGFLITMALSYLLLAVGANSAVALGVGVVLMDLGCQGAHVTNQNVIFPLRPDARSRLNTAYMTSLFVAFSIGGALSAVVYPVYGWIGVSILGGAFPAVGALLWVAETARARSGRRPAEVTPQEAAPAS